LKHWLERWQPSESLVLIAIALLVGLTSGAGVWLFKWLIEITHQLAFGQLGEMLAQWGGWTVFLIPALGGLIVGLIVHLYIGEERHHGFAGIMEAVALASQPTTSLRETTSITQASEYFAQTHWHGVPIVNDLDELIGIFTLQDLSRIEPSRWSTSTVGETCTRNLVVTYPDETIGTALRKMGTRDIGRIPVVSRENPRRLIGILRRSDLVRSYSIALSRRAAIRHRAHQIRLDATTQADVRVEEVLIKRCSLCAGKRINQVTWPRDCILATLRRGSQVLIPHGDTVLKSGDVLVAVAEGDAADELKRLCQTQITEMDE
jgi:CBS domain-containing protein